MSNFKELIQAASISKAQRTYAEVSNLYAKTGSVIDFQMGASLPNELLLKACEALESSTIIDDLFWQKENINHLALALHGVANEMNRALQEIREALETVKK